MALHIQMTPEAEAALKRNALRNKLSSLLACVIFFLVGGSILYFTAIYISKAMPAAFDVYTPAADDAAPTNKPKVKELTSKTTPTSSSVAPSVIVSASASPVAMAEVDIPTTDIPIGTGMDIDLGLGAGIGTGLGEGGGGMGSGDSGGSALEGTYYDFKQTARGASTGIGYVGKTVNVEEKHLITMCKVLGAFCKSWSRTELNKYYQAETKLYASSWYVPNVDGGYGPIAFQAKDKIKPGMWAAVYEGKVRAPKSGRFRFVGGGNHLIVVRFDKKVVLEAGYAVPSLYKASDDNPWKTWGMKGSYDKAYRAALAAGKEKDHRDYKVYPMPEISGWNGAFGGMIGGNIITVEEGKVYPISILVTDPAGGTFGFALLMEDVDNPNMKNGKPLFDIFRTNFSLPDKAKLEAEIKKAGVGAQKMQFPPYNPDSLIWTAVP